MATQEGFSRTIKTITFFTTSTTLLQSKVNLEIEEPFSSRLLTVAVEMIHTKCLIIKLFNTVSVSNIIHEQKMAFKKFPYKIALENKKVYTV